MTNKSLGCEFFFIERNMNPTDFFSKHFYLQKDMGRYEEDEVIVMTFPSIKFNYKDQIYKLSYNERKLSDNVFSISITLPYENNKEKHAIILDKVMGFINEKRNHNFSLILTRNDSLNYFSNRLYKQLYDFETNLRSLVKFMLIPDNKEEWHKEVTSQVNVTTKMSNKEKIENIIEELSITDLEALLFEKKFPKDSNLFEEELAKEQIEKLTKQEIINMINLNRPVSFWDTYFSRYIEYDLMNAMKTIKASRNNVAHYREFDSEQYKETLSILNDVNPLIKRTIKRLRNFGGDISVHMSREMQNKVIDLMRNLVEQTTDVANIVKNLKLNVLKDYLNAVSQFRNMNIFDEE
ncbi:hypothetical protein D8Y04_13795 [Listeria seeligeri]|uniref:hypothetical protein n=2 Tax=Listeria seeligeri TaxID=1640 RepID=UPI001941A173|nr:hypothetical protein [Listeria seeligeri]MBM5696262.1 hypothetical protein [Listeria seeligeri]